MGLTHKRAFGMASVLAERARSECARSMRAVETIPDALGLPFQCGGEE